jgi:hypothetical protein
MRGVKTRPLGLPVVEETHCRIRWARRFQLIWNTDQINRCTDRIAVDIETFKQVQALRPARGPGDERLS